MAYFMFIGVSNSRKYYLEEIISIHGSIEWKIFVKNGFLLNSINDTMGAMFEWQGADLSPWGKGIYTNTVPFKKMFDLEITYQ